MRPPEKKSCFNCRFWSQMVAQSIGGGPIEALCLGHGPHNSKYVRATDLCDAHKSDHHGKVDDPPNYGELSRAAYEAEERKAKRLKLAVMLASLFDNPNAEAAWMQARHDLSLDEKIAECARESGL